MKMLSIVFVLILGLVLINVARADIIIEEDFEDGVDDTFPDRFTMINTVNWDVEDTGAINGSLSLHMKNTALGDYSFIYHDTAPSDDYCFIYNAKALGADTAFGHLGRNPTGDDGYALEGHTGGTTGDLRTFEFSGGGITDAHAGDHETINLNANDLYVVRGCYVGTTHYFNVTRGVDFTEGSTTDATFTTGYFAMYGYMDGASREVIVDNICVFNGTSTEADCFSAAPPPEPSITINTDMTNNTNNVNINITINYNATFVGNYSDNLYECQLLTDDVITEISEDVNLSNNNQFIYDTTGVEEDVWIEVRCFTGDVEPISNLNLTYGNYIAGDSTSFQNLSDGYAYNASEATGSPGYMLEINFSPVSDFNEIDLEYYYDGSLQHTLNFEMWNYTAGAWDVIFNMPTNNEYEILGIIDFNDTDYVNSTLVQTRFDHVSAGNVNHLISIEHLELRGEDIVGLSGKFNYSIDVVLPIITINWTNASEYTQLDTVTHIVNFSDLNLFAYNISYLDDNGALWSSQNYFAENLTITNAQNETEFTATDIGTFTVRYEIWDSHTSYVISDYDWDKYSINVSGKTFKGISFANNKFNISTDDYSEITGWSLIKTKDRYMMAINFSTTGFYFDIYYASSKPIKYLDYSKYPGHFIIGNKHWIDHQPQSESMISDLSVTYKENYDAYRVRFYVDEPNVIFESIGDLNYVTTTYTYSVVAAIALSTDLLSDINQTTKSINATLSIMQEDTEDIKEAVQMIPIVMLLVGVMFWLVYAGSTLNVKTEDEKVMPINALIKMLMYGFAGFLAFVSIQLALGISITNELADMLTGTLEPVYSLAVYGGILITILVIIGTTYVHLIRLVEWMKEVLSSRKERE